MVEGTALEKRQARKGLGSSNLPLSAKKITSGVGTINHKIYLLQLAHYEDYKDCGHNTNHRRSNFNYITPISSLYVYR